MGRRLRQITINSVENTDNPGRCNIADAAVGVADMPPVVRRPGRGDGPADRGR